LTDAASPDSDIAAPTENQVPCIVCRAMISEHARLCPTCRSYQRSWKNSLAYFGSTAGFLAILFSALTFILSRINETYHSWQWHDEISIVYFEYPGPVGFINRGDGDLYLVSADIDWNAGQRHITVPLGVAVPKDKFVSTDTVAFYERPDNVDQGDWASGDIAQYLSGLYAESAKDKSRSRCAEFHFFASPHTVFSRIDQILHNAGTYLLTAPAQGHLNVISVHSGEVLEPAPVLRDLKIAFVVVGPMCRSSDVSVTEATFPRTGGGMGISEPKKTTP
jgi:hypothetical protein